MVERGRVMEGVKKQDKEVERDVWEDVGLENWTS